MLLPELCVARTRFHFVDYNGQTTRAVNTAIPEQIRLVTTRFESSVAL
jgi:hypothetical protein